MALLEKSLFIKKSNLPQAGKGLFTKIEISKGTRILEYKGKMRKWKEVKHLDGYNGYLMYITRNAVIDALHYKKTLGRYANDARGFSRIPKLRNNCEFVSEARLYKGPRLAGLSQLTTTRSTGNISVWIQKVGHSNTRGTVSSLFFPAQNNCCT